jgi:glycosyltransferase involved in cell wall biosynthesis
LPHNKGVLISIIVPAFNEERLLGDSLAAIRAGLGSFSARGWKTELIVCDNNSTDGTAEVAQGAGARVVFEPINQIGRARNRGAATASGDWFIFVDADSRPSSGLFGAVAEAISRGCCLAGGSTVRLDEDHPKANWIVSLWNVLSRTFKLLAGSFIFCDAAAFREVGGFSEELFAGEELELSQKLKQAAKRRGKSIVILHENPLMTSARKVHLYRTRDHVWFFIKAICGRRKTLTSREACFAWYDGRR